MHRIMIVIGLILISFNLMAQPIPRPRPIPIPMPEPQKAAVCKRTCSDSMAKVSFYQQNVDGPLVCPEVSQVVHGCAPFGCDAKAVTCRTECTEDSHCSAGFACNQNTRKCETVSYFCTVNQFNAGTLNGTDGTYRHCEPYTCRMNNCLYRCTSQMDCWPGYQCASDYTCKRY